MTLELNEPIDPKEKEALDLLLGELNDAEQVKVLNIVRKLKIDPSDPLFTIMIALEHHKYLLDLFPASVETMRSETIELDRRLQNRLANFEKNFTEARNGSERLIKNTLKDHQIEIKKYHKRVEDHDELEKIFDRDIRIAKRNIQGMKITLTAGLTACAFMCGWLVCKLFFSGH